jgi:ABC-type phosphate/phosphonate transport system permease subunit
MNKNKIIVGAIGAGLIGAVTYLSTSLPDLSAILVAANTLIAAVVAYIEGKK